MRSFLIDPETPHSPSLREDADGFTRAATILILAAFYFAAAKFSFLMAFKAEQVSVVWPPTGIALAATLLFGYRIWPGILLGAFLANITSHEPFAVAGSIAIGNMLESIAGAWMLHRLAGFDNALGRIKDVWSLLLFAAILGTMISATIGVTTLCLGHVQPWSAYRQLWLFWWVGDATGALIVAPLLLVWSTLPRFFWHAWNTAEIAALAAGFGLACAGVFANDPLVSINNRAFTYPVFPFIIWAAIRFGQRATTLVTLAASLIAIWATMHDMGAFASTSVEQSLAMLQTFMAVVAITGLFLSAAIAQHREAEEALKKSDGRKDEFLTTLAHELRNPLAPIVNAVHLLQLPNIGAEQRTKLYALMERQLGHILRLVEDLVDVSRISHGKIELRKQCITLAEAVNAACEAVQPLVDEHRHTFSVRLPDEPLWLDADLTRLAQIFTNLLNNAAKYTLPNGRISLEVKKEEDVIVVRISDTGIGISSTMLPHVFEMFAQAESALERSHGGLGIGLTLVKKLVAMHGGDVTATSQGKGMGSEFIVRLPLASPPQIATDLASAPKAMAPGPRKFRILLADDNESFAETFSQMLKLLGHKVQVVHDGQSAVDVAQLFLPEVVLLDIGLPEINGYDVCKKIRAMPALKRCVFIAQTGFSQPEHRERSKAAGFDHHLIKPIKIDYMEELLLSLNPSVLSPADESAA